MFLGTISIAWKCGCQPELKSDLPNGSDYTTINAGEGDDFIDNDDSDLVSSGWIFEVTISGGAGNDYIYNEDSFVTIDGGAGNDTLNGAGGNNTFTGGKGKNIFIYNGGNDIITDYKKNDKINTSLAYDDFEIDGKNLIFNFGDEKVLRFKTARAKLLT